jgi:nucleoside-diphosphate-sugar epimerase
MRIFVTGATGFIGSALIPQLLDGGHEVLGLTRSEEGARALEAAGAQVQHGTIENLDSLRAGAAASDGVIHLAFNHDFSQFQKSAENDRKAIEAMGEVLEGSNRPLVITSGTALATMPDRQPVTEDGGVVIEEHPRAASEQAAKAVAARGVNTTIVRLPQVHDTRKQGLVTYLVALAREKGVSAYVGDGCNRWPAAHVSSVAQLYRLALEKAQPGAIYHAVDEKGVPLKAIAEALGRGLELPVVSLPPDQAEAHFGFLGLFAGHDLAASSALTRQRLGWTPSGPGLIADLDAMDYTRA